MDQETRRIAMAIIKQRIECSTEDINLFIREMGDRLLDFGFIGEGSTRKFAVEIIADENLFNTPKHVLENKIEALTSKLGKEYDGMYSRSKIGRIRGGCAGALNRDLGRFETKVDILKSRITRINEVLKVKI